MSRLPTGVQMGGVSATKCDTVPEAHKYTEGITSQKGLSGFYFQEKP